MINEDAILGFAIDDRVTLLWVPNLRDKSG